MKHLLIGVCVSCSFFLFGQLQSSQPPNDSLRTKVFLPHELAIEGEPPYEIAPLTPVSPNASSLGIYGFIPVGHYTGIPKIEIPIYEIELDGLKIPIKLSYHASGIKLTQNASWAGLGWALIAGGTISREIRGIDDLFDTGFCFHKNLDPVDGRDNEPDLSLSKYVFDYYASRKADTEPDLFSYNFFGYSGKMCFKNTTFDLVKQNGDHYLDIKYTPELNDLAAGTTIGQWAFTDGSGFRYYFQTSETSLNINYGGYLNEYGRIENKFSKYFKSTARSPYNVPNKIVTSWLLDSIVSPQGRAVVFKYKTDNLSTDINYSERRVGMMGGRSTNSNEYCWIELIKGEYEFETCSYSNVKQQLLEEIIFPNGKIQFQTSDRQDIDPAVTFLYSDESITSVPIGFRKELPQKLSKIIISNKNKSFAKEFELQYRYEGDKRPKMFLDKVWDKSTGYYTFQYRHLFYNRLSEEADRWGFYNGQPRKYKYFNTYDELVSGNMRGTLIPSTLIYEKTNTVNFNFYFGANTTPDPDKMQEGILTDIYFPTGGSTSFQYEPHVLNNYEFDDFELERISDKKVILDDSTVSTGRDTLAFEIGVDSCYWLLNSRLELNGTKYHDFPSNLLYVSIYKKLGNGMVELIRIFEINSINNSIYLSAGKYIMCYDSECYIYLKRNTGFKFTAYLQRIKPTHINYGAGLRVKQIKTKNTDGTVISKIYKYNHKNTERSSGNLMYFPRTIGYLGSFTFKGKNQEDERKGMLYYPNLQNLSFFNSAMSESTSAAGSLVGYSYVEEIQIDQNNQNMGKTGFHFYNIPDKTVDHNYSEEIQEYWGGGDPMPRHLLDYPRIENKTNGLPWLEEFFDKNGLLVRSVQSDYEEIPIEGDFIKGYNCCFGYHGGPIGRFYDMKPTTTQKISTVTMEYKGDYATSIQINRYKYNNKNFLCSEEVMSTSDKKLMKRTKLFPNNYPDPLFLNIKNKHLFDKQIEEIVQLDSAVIEANRYTYTDVSGTILHKSSESLKKGQPMNPQNFRQYYENVGAEIERFDMVGKYPVQIKLKDDIRITYLWGYNRQYPVAEIRNATYLEIENLLGVPFLNILSSSEDFSLDNQKKLNDLRDKMPLAQISIFTYRPLVGILTKTDERGIVTYYNYDLNGRLTEIYLMEDGTKKIIKTYDYHYRE